MNELRHLVSEESDGERADRFLFGELSDSYSRSDIQRWFADGLVSVGEKKIRKSALLHTGDLIEVSDIPPKPSSDLLPEAIPLRILFEDDHLLVINKSKGLVVHPGSGILTGTLAAGLLHHCNNLSRLNGPLRPGIVHRLDRETSGVMVAAKNDAAHRSLAQQFQEQTVERIYRALAWGIPDEEEGVLEGKIGRDPKNRLKMAILPEGREARTHYKVVEKWRGAAEWELRLETGRTHQIRIHLAQARHPVIGDPTYSGREQQLDQMQPMDRQLLKPLLKLCDSQALQAVEIAFDHPVTGERVRFTAPPDPELEAARHFLRDITARLYPQQEQR